MERKREQGMVKTIAIRKIKKVWVIKKDRTILV